MLHSKTVEPITFSVLKELMQIPELKNFNLVGGTALALKYGHRISIDIDMFSTEKIEKEKILLALENHFKSDLFYEFSKMTFAIFCKIKNIKVDLVFYPHKTIGKIEEIENIRLYSISDIAAMKINAILGRGVKKDFYDLAQILENHTLEQVILWHKEKFPNQMLMISIPNAILYFEDAELSENPISINGQTWESVKLALQKHVREFLA